MSELPDWPGYEWVGPPCDSDEPNIYMMGLGKIGCRCLTCGRCGKHTGNATQGHLWSFCKKTKKLEKPHACCPTLECEI